MKHQLWKTNCFWSRKSTVANHACRIRGDIKDALLKMVLFTNLSHVTADGKQYSPFPVVGLTADLLQGYCHSAMDDSQIEKFLKRNGFNDRARTLVGKIFQEGRVNHFFVSISSPKIEARQILCKLNTEY